jgi:hypothetical protein
LYPGRPLVTPGSDPANPSAYEDWDHIDWVLVIDDASRGYQAPGTLEWGAVAGTILGHYRPSAVRQPNVPTGIPTLSPTLSPPILGPMR